MNTTQALNKLEQDYAARRNALMAEQAAADARIAELARTAETEKEEQAQAAALAAAQAALEKSWSEIEPQIGDLVSDCVNAQQAFARHWNEIGALITMAGGFQDRAAALAYVVGSVAGRHPGAFESANARLDWISNRLGMLPSAGDLTVASADTIRTDLARALGIRIVRQDLLRRSLEQRAASGLAAGRRGEA